MQQIINPSADPYFNMALEEHCIRHLPAEDDYFMLWQNTPAVIVGRNQNTLEEVNANYLDEQGIVVVRRLSGGGAVFHDPGNLNFTFVVEENQDFNNFEKFTRPVIRALQRIGIFAENNGRNDITIAGKKFSGNAQFKHKNRLLHHGTILFATDIEQMTKALNPSPEKISSKGIKSVRSRVTNVADHLPSALTIEEFKQILTEEVFRLESNQKIYRLSDADRQLTNELRDQKYARWEWNYGTSPPYNLRQVGSFCWGNLDIRLEVKRGLIRSCRIFGDFFSPREISELESQLLGTPFHVAGLRQRLSEIDLCQFFPQSSLEEILSLLTKS